MASANVESARSSRSGKKFLASSIGDVQIIGYYSTDAEQNYLANSSRMSYFKAPRSTQVRMDLNHGIESVVRFPRASAGDGSLSHFLEWIVRNHTDTRGFGSNRWIEPDFVTSSGVLRRLMYTPYWPRCEWEIRAAKWKGTIYLCSVVTQSDENRRLVQPRIYSSWGYKLEQYFVSVDAVESATVLKDPLPLKDLKLVELKAKKSLQHAGQQRFFTENILPQWWAHSFPTGTDKILCGWRDNEGIVHEWTTYSLDQMIELGQGAWDPQICIDRCNDFLDSCAKLVLDDCDKTVYKFEKTPYNRVRVTQLPASYSFIPTAVLAKMGASGAV